MSAKVFFASVFVALAIMAPVTYFVLPLLYPGMNDESGVIQSVYEEFDDTAFIVDAVNTFELINQTELTVTTKGGSFLTILFAMQTVLGIDPAATGALQFEIAVVVETVGNNTIKVAHFNSAPYGTYREIPADVTINYVTETLTAGNYTVSVYWKATYDIGGVNYMIGNNPPNYDYSRTLWIQEMVM